MRISGFLIAILFFACVNPPYTYGQSGDQRRAEEQLEPYHKHHDTRHGHDHSYPDRGAIMRDLPRGTIGVNYAGVSYRFHDGVWLEPRGPAFIVVAPPIGLVVPTLPPFATSLTHGGETYLYANEAYYRPRPDLGGYEVVNDPVEAASPAGSDKVVSTQPSSAVTTAVSQAAALPLTTAAVVIGAPAPVPVPVPTATASVPVAATAPVSAATPSPLAHAAVPPLPASGATPPLPPSAAAPAAPLPTPAAAPPLPTPAAAPPLPTPAAAPSLPAAAAATTPVSMTAAAAPASVAAATIAAATLTTTPSPASPSAPPRAPKVFLYPKNGQSADQQAHDRYECYRFGVAQSGFDPMRSTGGASPPPNGELQSDFERAQAACFEARGYTSR